MTFYIKSLFFLCNKLSNLILCVMCYLVSFILLLFALLFFVLHVKAEKDFWQRFCGILSIVALVSCVVFSFLAHWAYGLFVNFPLCHAAFYPLCMWEASRPIAISSSKVTSWGVFLFFVVFFVLFFFWKFVIISIFIT